MKTRTFVLILILVLAVLILAGSCATKRKVISDEDISRVYSGTWINEEYDGSYSMMAKMIYFRDGTWEIYSRIEDKYTYDEGVTTITEKWIDSNGDIWFECIWESNIYGAGHQLTKISDAGNTLEMLWTESERRVEEWNPNDLNYTYRIYYRQE